MLLRSDQLNQLTGSQHLGRGDSYLNVYLVTVSRQSIAIAKPHLKWTTVLNAKKNKNALSEAFFGTGKTLSQPDSSLVWNNLLDHLKTFHQEISAWGARNFRFGKDGPKLKTPPPESVEVCMYILNCIDIYKYTNSCYWSQEPTFLSVQNASSSFHKKQDKLHQKSDLQVGFPRCFLQWMTTHWLWGPLQSQKKNPGRIVPMTRANQKAQLNLKFIHPQVVIPCKCEKKYAKGALNLLFLKCTE